MYWPDPEIKKDPYKRWHRPDRIFFGYGACHILAGVYLNQSQYCACYGEWIVPRHGLPGHHMYVTDGQISFDFHGYTRRDALLSHHRHGWSRRYEGWSADILRIDFDLLDTAALNARNHLGPDQFWADPIPRALDFIARFDIIDCRNQKRRP